MTDDVLAVKYSPDNKLLAVSLLDSTVKVFFQDSLKFFLSLYGHKVCRDCKRTHVSEKADRYTSPVPSYRSCRWTSRKIPS
jgi:hypothetical protein